jgi:transcriptional regulator with XRE-family HTH domain
MMSEKKNPGIKLERSIKHTPKGIDKTRVLELRLKELSYREIAQLVGCSKSNIEFIMRNHFPNLTNLQKYSENKAKILEALQQELVYQFDAEKQKKMTGRDLTWSIAVLEDKIRLIRGQSTENINIKQELKTLAELEEREKEIKRLLGLTSEEEEKEPGE